MLTPCHIVKLPPKPQAELDQNYFWYTKETACMKYAWNNPEKPVWNI